MKKISMFFVFMFMFALVTTVSAANFEPTNHEVLMLDDQQPPDQGQPQQHQRPQQNQPPQQQAPQPEQPPQPE